ncbi:50S ribosomal protein L10 [Candidatus Woesearchaeota archaeon]|nr:50S ribosomal protein L10 [Candidatus Woesearchaeota archaeon]
MAHVSDFKKKTVNDIVKLSREYPIVGVVNMENLPGPQLQAMRAELRNKVELFMTKKTIMKVALEKIKPDRNGIEELEKYFVGMPALIFTKESPFRLARILRKSKTPAPAKAGQTAPNDIIIPKGPTPFAPGPVISEFSSIGLKVGVESGKVAVKEDSVVAKKGEKITGKVADVLTRLGIKPMEVGLSMMVAYENGVIYQKEILDVDEQQYISSVNLAALQGFNLAFNITYVTKDNAKLLIGKAFTDAKALGLSQNIIDKEIINELLAKAERSMLSLKGTANIETVEKLKGKHKAEEPKQEIKQEEPKPKEAKEPAEEHKKETRYAEKPAEKKAEIEPEVKKEKLAEPEKVESKQEEPVKEEEDELLKEELEELDKEAREITEKANKQSEFDEKEAQIEEDLKRKKEEEEQKRVEGLAKELLKKGTLRK